MSNISIQKPLLTKATRLMLVTVVAAALAGCGPDADGGNDSGAPASPPPASDSSTPTTPAPGDDSSTPTTPAPGKGSTTP